MPRRRLNFFDQFFKRGSSFPNSTRLALKISVEGPQKTSSYPESDFSNVMSEETPHWPSPTSIPFTVELSESPSCRWLIIYSLYGYMIQ